MTALDPSRLEAFGHQQGIPVEVFSEVNSTNTWLQNTPGTELRMCFADTQTQGRGQRGRQWHSPPSDNIYFSCRYPFKAPAATLAGLSLAVSVSLHRLLQARLPGQPLAIKWPNDILCDTRKLAGILVELVTQPELTLAIIGIGINVNMMPEAGQPISQAWTSLRQLTGHAMDRHLLCQDLIVALPATLQAFEATGLVSFLDAWQAADALRGQPITVQHNNRLFQGTAQGIDRQGRLVMETTDGWPMVFSSGEASLVPHRNTAFQ